ncbi:primase-helicase family protein [Qipengyuania gaetbuli]|uniref:primase-helicase family protein n=1 Tax=Qipengyuania gaetbuli TaxID=266952 RepID=UPI001CD4DE0F|nr:primase-helicase family protein [Qipengyuania gaetbuli]MCA0910071.1 DUF5906 domain-containing protein [Qipengyuania gaetbuli]
MAIGFLRQYRPEGPWVLTAIPDGGGRTKTKTFQPETEAAAREWIQRWNEAERHHVYFMANPPMRDLDKKASKEDVKEAAVFYVDIDPKAGEDPAAARFAAIKDLEAFDPPPSIIIDSGGGAQGIWLLEEALPIEGNLTAAEDAELYNVHLEAKLGGDHCHNADRILRLVGTINWKRKPGRVPRMASLDEKRSTWCRYPVKRFTAAPPRHVSPSAGQAKVQLEGVPAFLRDLDELPEAVSKRTRMLIVQGGDPDDAQRYASRSEVTFGVCTELVRAGCSDEQIAAVLLDPDFGISKHTLAQKRSLEYAARQIKRAREEVNEPMLARMNAAHAVIELYGGKTKVVSWEPSEVDPSRKEIVAQSFEDFRNRYMNIKVQSGVNKDNNPVYVPAGKWWLEHPMRRQYRSVVFRPSEKVDEDEWNIWQGLAVKPEPGEWPLLRRLIVEGLAGGDKSLADYIIRWSAFGVQNPGRPAEVALTFIGGKGTGKGTFARVLCQVFGQHARHVAGERSLTSNFNKHLHGCALLFADEAVAPGEKNAAGLVKAFITENEIMIEPKGVDAFFAPNRLKVIIASNNTYVVDASDDERRYAVFNVSRRFAAPPGASMDDERMMFWRDLRAEIANGGTEAFLHDLLEIDLGDWHPRYDVPQTSALNEQRAAGLKGFDKVLFDILQSGDLPALDNLRKIGGDQFVLPSRQLAEYGSNVSRRKVTTNWVSNLLGPGQPDEAGVIHNPGLGFEKWDRGGPKGWVMPTLGEARAAWARCRFEWQWDDSERWGYESAVIEDQPSGDDREPPPADDDPY